MTSFLFWERAAVRDALQRAAPKGQGADTGETDNSMTKSLLWEEGKWG